jgi:hypothetical protein
MVVVLLLGLLLSGCTTALRVKGDADARLVRALQEIPRDGAWEKAQCWAGVSVYVTSTVPTLAIGLCSIYVNPSVLDWPHEVIRAGLAHELGHLFNNDTVAWRRSVPQVKKEQEADVVAARLLSRISPEACLALPQLLEKLQSDPNHPAPAERATETRALCSQLAKVK